MNLAAVIVTHNRCQKLQHTLAATLAQPFSAVIVVDNASTDGTRAWLAGQHDPRLHLILSEQNSGGAGGFAQGMTAALNYDPDWLVCYDDDAYPAPDALQQFTVLDLGNTDSAAAAVYYPDGRICEMNRPSYNPFWHPRKLWQTALGLITGRARTAFHLEHAAYAQSASVTIDSSSFVGYFVRADWVRRCGVPDAALFIYGDDTHYTLSLRQQGARHVFLPAVRFIHDCTAYPHRHGAYHPMWKAYFAMRNSLHTYRLAAGIWYYPVALLRILAWLAAVRHYQQKHRYLRLWWQAVSDGLRRDLGRDPTTLIRDYSDDAPNTHQSNP